MLAAYIYSERKDAMYPANNNNNTEYIEEYYVAVSYVQLYFRIEQEQHGT